MHYLVKGEFLGEMLAGKTPDETAMYFQQVIKPSLEQLWKLSEEKTVVGGVVAGERETAFILHVDSNEEVGRVLRTLPFWGANRWSVMPLQSFQSAIDQHRDAIESMREMVVSH